MIFEQHLTMFIFPILPKLSLQILLTVQENELELFMYINQSWNIIVYVFKSKLKYFIGVVVSDMVVTFLMVVDQSGSTLVDALYGHIYRGKSNFLGLLTDEDNMIYWILNSIVIDFLLICLYTRSCSSRISCSSGIFYQNKFSIQ